MTSFAPENFSGGGGGGGGGGKLITIHRKPKNLNFFRIRKRSPSSNAITLVSSFCERTSSKGSYHRTRALQQNLKPYKVSFAWFGRRKTSFRASFFE